MKFYQHIMIYGGPGAFTVRMGNNTDNERTFRTYNEAILAVIEYLSQSASVTVATPGGSSVLSMG